MAKKLNGKHLTGVTSWQAFELDKINRSIWTFGDAYLIIKLWAHIFMIVRIIMYVNSLSELRSFQSLKSDKSKQLYK